MSTIEIIAMAGWLLAILAAIYLFAISTALKCSTKRLERWIADCVQAEYERDRYKFTLQFYAGKLREDGNGYEFEAEPYRGNLARTALKDALRP